MKTRNISFRGKKKEKGKNRKKNRKKPTQTNPGNTYYRFSTVSNCPRESGDEPAWHLKSKGLAMTSAGSPGKQHPSKRHNPTYYQA